MTIDADTLKYYVRDLVPLLVEQAVDAKRAAQQFAPKPEEAAFESGKAFGTYLALSIMIQQAKSFGIPLEDLGLEHIEPERELAKP
jgi:hypothetical protein